MQGFTPAEYAPEQTLARQEALRFQNAAIGHGLRYFRFLNLLLLPLLGLVSRQQIAARDVFLLCLTIAMAVQFGHLLLHFFGRSLAVNRWLSLSFDCVSLGALAHLSGGTGSVFIALLALLVLYSVTSLDRVTILTSGAAAIATLLLLAWPVWPPPADLHHLLMPTFLIAGIAISAGELAQLIRFSHSRTVHTMLAQIRATLDSQRNQAVSERDKERYRILLESVNGIPWEYSVPAQRFTYIGPQVESISGYARDIWCQAGFLQLHVVDEDKELVSRMLHLRDDNGRKREFEYRLRTAADSEIWLLNIVNNGSGAEQSALLRGIMFDISQRKTTEMELNNYRGNLEKMVLERTEQLKEANQQLELLTLHDPLTGLANRRFFANEYLKEWRRALRRQSNLAVIMIDVDGFKSYNDLYGHVAGDECLRRVAQVLAGELLRASDFIARYGGEEFVVLLADINPTESLAVAEKLRNAVLSAALPHRGAPGGCLTVSLGVWSSTVDTSTPEEILQRADSALYQAKNTGRNRVVMVPEHGKVNLHRVK